MGEREKKSEDKESDNHHNQSAAEKIKRARDAVNQTNIDREGDNGGKSEKHRTIEVAVHSDNREDHHRNSNHNASGDGIFFDVLDKLVFDAGGVFL